MKKYLLILLLPLVGYGQVVHYPAYVAYYNPITKIPDSIVYIATPHKKVASRSAGFHAMGGRPNLERDYKHSGFDIGHNADASDMNGNKIDEYNSFDFINTYPQRPNCNRITWLALENYVRQLANKYGSVRVKVYWHGVSGYMGVDKVTIPAYCDKEIWYNGKHESYYMPNTASVNAHPFTFYRK